MQLIPSLIYEAKLNRLTLTEDPVTGEQAGAVDALVESNGAETGIRFEPDQALNASLVGVWLKLDSELHLENHAQPNQRFSQRSTISAIVKSKSLLKSGSKASNKTPVSVCSDSMITAPSGPPVSR